MIVTPPHTHLARQMCAQPEEAVELYLAADRPTAALSLINSQMSAAIAAAADEAAAAAPGGGAMSPAPGGSHSGQWLGAAGRRSFGRV